MRKTTLFVAFCIFVLTACATYRLERALPKDIREWHDLHRHIMQYRVPEYIHPKEITEANYFLRLPVELQRKYIKLFWDIRWIDAKSNFVKTVNLANAAFRSEGIDGWRTDRGKMLLMLGQPDDIYQYRITNGVRDPIVMGGEEEWDGYSKHYQVWIYRFGRGFFQTQARFTFEYDSMRRWRFNNVWNWEQRECLNYYQHFMSPIEWEPWLREIGRQ